MARKRKETRGRKPNEFGPKKTYTIGLYPWAKGRIEEAALANGISISLWLTNLASRELGVDLNVEKPPAPIQSNQSIQEGSNA